ncbi:MAG: hypothetical protein LUE65_03430 [Clostridiales bacterium]|nr:hypothetical protein [Clostridiales bacterium]
MVRKYTLSQETVEELETFSVDFEQLGNLIDLLDQYVQQNVLNGDQAILESKDRTASLIMTVADIVRKCRSELLAVFDQIVPTDHSEAE